MLCPPFVLLLPPTPPCLHSQPFGTTTTPTAESFITPQSCLLPQSRAPSTPRTWYLYRSQCLIEHISDNPSSNSATSAPAVSRSQFSPSADGSPMVALKTATLSRSACKLPGTTESTSSTPPRSTPTVDARSRWALPSRSSTGPATSTS